MMEVVHQGVGQRTDVRGGGYRGRAQDESEVGRVETGAMEGLPGVTATEAPEGPADPLEGDPRLEPYFGAAWPAVHAFAALLRTHGSVRGLLGPNEGTRLWDRHLLNCAVLAELLPDRGELVDIGSGAGLPGIVLAMLRPEVHVILLDE